MLRLSVRHALAASASAQQRISTRFASAITLNADGSLQVKRVSPRFGASLTISNHQLVSLSALCTRLSSISDTSKLCLSHARQVPNDPIIPFIEGDGTGPDIWKASQYVLDGAVQKAYNGERKIEWLEVLAGEKAFRQTGMLPLISFNTHLLLFSISLSIHTPCPSHVCVGEWLPAATLDAYRQYLVGIKVSAHCVEISSHMAHKCLT